MLPAGEEDEGWAEEELAAAEVDAIDLLFDLSKSQRMGVSGGEAFATRVLRELSSVFSPLSHALSRPSSLAWQLNCTFAFTTILQLWLPTQIVWFRG